MSKFIYIAFLLLINIFSVERLIGAELDHKWIMVQPPNNEMEFYMDLYNSNYDGERLTYYVLFNYVEPQGEGSGTYLSQISKIQLNCEVYNYWDTLLSSSIYSGAMGEGFLDSYSVEGTKHQRKMQITPDLGMYGFLVSLCDSAIVGKIPEIQKFIKNDQLVSRMRREVISNPASQEILTSFWSNLLDPYYPLN
jgi:hypothetical protein